MRLLSYNILDGGIGREDLWTAVAEAQRPDIVALVEAHDPGVVEHLAGRLGMDFIHAPGRSHASALLSRTPITSTVNHALLRETLEKSLLEATVRRPDGGELTIGVAHLHAGAYEADEAAREQEIAVVLSLFARQRAAKTPHLLCGDFNANAPYQRIDPQRCKPSTRAAWEANGGQVPRRVVQRILDAGYVDTLHAFDSLAGQTHATFTTGFPGQRVDYIFAFGVAAQRIGHASVITADGAKEASDHFPVVAHLLHPHGLGLA